MKSCAGRVWIALALCMPSVAVLAQPPENKQIIRARVRQLMDEVAKHGELEIEGGVTVRTKVPTPTGTIAELRDMGGPAIDALGELLLDCVSASRRRLVVDTLGRIGTPKASDPLALAAQSDPDPGIREIASVWLAHIAWDRAGPVLRSLRATDPVETVREAAARLLSEHRDGG